MKLSVLVIALVFWPFHNGIGQNNETSVKFEKTIHNFGYIEEANGLVAYNFQFTNTGTSELSIEEVLADCGCTSPEWIERPVKPGGKGFIKAEYNPADRPGEFDKALIIFFKNDIEPVELFIKGNVVPKLKSIEEEYPVVMGGIRVKYRNISFEKITTEKPITKTVTVYNEMNKSAIWESDIETAKHISVVFNPEEIPKKSYGEIIVTYDPRGLDMLGYKGDKLIVSTDEWFNSTKKFRIIAFIEEYFPPVTAEQLAQVPILKIGKPIHDFGKIKHGNSVEHNFLITNTGKEELNIRMTRASCGCTASIPEKDNLKPGESSNIHVTFNSEGKSGQQEEIILVFSNDPVNPTQKLRIKAWVKNEDTH
jgi:hypothetical protein